MAAPTGKGPVRRLARQFREAALNATHEEAPELDRLYQLHKVGAISAFDASRILTDVIRGQHERRERRAA